MTRWPPRPNLSGAFYKAHGLGNDYIYVAQDIRGFYEMAALGLSDHIPSAWAGTNWFLDDTQSGKLILAARAAIRDTGEKRAWWFRLTPGNR